jgi:hypothetical protein
VISKKWFSKKLIVNMLIPKEGSPINKPAVKKIIFPRTLLYSRYGHDFAIVSFFKQQ